MFKKLFSRKRRSDADNIVDLRQPVWIDVTNYSKLIPLRLEDISYYQLYLVYYEGDIVRTKDRMYRMTTLQRAKSCNVNCKLQFSYLD